MKHFCIAPFVHIQQNSIGQINPCCIYNKKQYEKDYSNFYEAFNSTENHSLRQRMIRDERIEGCEKCYRDDQLGKKSYREIFNSKYDKSYVENPIIKELEISFGNKCNFKCVTCNSKFSSSWYNDDKFLSTNSDMKRKLYDRKQLLLPDNFNYENLRELELLKILGGEPFLDKRYLEFFDKLQLENITLFIVTNNSFFPSSEWIEYLKKFKKVKFNISLDGVYDTAEFVRYGTKFSKFEKNYRKWNILAKQSDNFEFIIPHFVFHSLNCLNFYPTLEWLCEIYDISYDIMCTMISYDFLNEPEYLNASFFPDNIKKIILEKNEKNYFFYDIIRDFLNMNTFNKRECKNLINYYNFLYFRDDIPDEISTIINLLKKEIYE